MKTASLSAAAGILAIVGYVAALDLRIAAALAGLAAWGGWTALARRHQVFALTVSFAGILAAGTKFRFRDAAASLEGTLDAQIIVELALYAAIGSAVAVIWLTRRERPRVARVEYVLLAYAALALLSTVWSAAPRLTLVRAVQLGILLALAMTAVRLLSPARALWIASVTLIGYVLICAAFAIAWPSMFGAPGDGGSGRFSWFALRPVGAGTLAALAALASLSACLHRPPRASIRHARLIAGAAAPPLLVILLLTKARGPLLACLAGIVVLLLSRVRGPTRARLLFAGAAALFVIVMIGPDVQAWLSAREARDSALSGWIFRGQRVDDVLGLSGRLELWEELRPLVASRVLFGYGYQGSRAIILEVASWAAYAHNAFLQTLLDLGAAGVMALGAVLVAAVAGPRALAVGVAPERTWLRAAAGAFVLFLTVNALASESFAAAPGIELLLLFLCALAGLPARGERA